MTVLQQQHFSLFGEKGTCLQTPGLQVVAPSSKSSTGSVVVSSTCFHDATVSKHDKNNNEGMSGDYVES